VHNLLADARARVRLGDHCLDVVARVPTDAERARLDAAADRVYPGFAAYRRRTARPIQAFVLEPAPASPAGPASQDAP
jgi:deazaflavin-dependent oxidoreductase (nitroreductase family)